MKVHLSVILALLVIFSIPASAFTTIEAGEAATVSVTTVIEDDLYIAGGNVIIQGTVLGDLIAAGGIVEISGNVTGDVMAGAGNVIINGEVGDDVRVGAGNVIINGNIADDLIVGTGTLFLADDAMIGGDAVFGSGQVELRGDVGGDILGGAEDVTLAGYVDGDVELGVASLNILPTASINGSLKYSGPEEAEIPSGVVKEDITFIEYVDEIEEDERVTGAGFVVWWLIKYLSLVLVGLVSLAIWPKRTYLVADRIKESPLKNFGLGFLLVIAGFVGSILLFVTVIGVPLGFALLFLTLFDLYATRIFFGLLIGKYIFSKLGRESKPWLEMVIGVFLLLILTSIPFVGFLIYLLVTFMAIGAVYHEQKRYYTDLKEKELL